MAAKKTNPKTQINVPAQAGKSEARQLAEVALNPAAQSLSPVQQFTKSAFGERDVSSLFGALDDQIAKMKSGDLSDARAMLAGQAIALNAIFSEIARRAGCNMGEYLQATQLYMNLALKAQAQCRATIEALDRLTNGHVQTVKHVHVSEGGQAVIADEFHHHTGGNENVQSDKQPHAPGVAGRAAALENHNAGNEHSLAKSPLSSQSETYTACPASS